MIMANFISNTQIFNKPLTTKFLSNNSYCIHDTKYIYYDNKLIIKNIITGEIIEKVLDLPHHINYKIAVADDFSFIFLLLIENNFSNIIIKINTTTWNTTQMKLNEIYQKIYIFKNYIFCVNIDKNFLIIRDFDNNIIGIYEDMLIINITTMINLNCIIISTIESILPRKEQIYLLEYDKGLFEIKGIYPNISCGYLDETNFYMYNNSDEIINIVNIKTNTIKTISTKLIINSFLYKNYYFGRMYMLPDNIHIILNDGWTCCQIWNVRTGKYIGSLYNSIQNFSMSFDNNYLIGIDQKNNYYAWKLDFGKFYKFKDLIKDKLPEYLLDNIQDIIFKSNIL